ncbi:ESPR-type extended signal peptide-containing protein [Variovorax sp. E3]|uniref:ESPR-type extended signal peptide-containing protein n=1 Tax=Variovorax sp. E3 TaxID=1914993 RepID=UPI0018DB465A|nr:ESPR-type extended signal peptide-containing protein [Variovorax sp. E3]
MNKFYRVVWSKVRMAWIVASEAAMTNGAGGRSASQSVGAPQARKARRRFVGTPISGAVVCLVLGLNANGAWASRITLCYTTGTSSTWSLNGSFSSGNGVGWQYSNATQGENNCSGSKQGVILAESDLAGGGGLAAGTSAYMWVGGTGNSAAGSITLYGPRAFRSMASHR